MQLGIGEVAGASEHCLAYVQSCRERRHLLEVAHAQAATSRDLARVGHVRSGEQAQERRLARAIRPDEPDPLALGQGERHPLEQGPAAERLRQSAGSNQNGHGVGSIGHGWG